ncbi:MAG: hypothetical protein LBE86_02665 [Gemmobacter sp.]|nr:hypothetical protein [Gemmobacter sp.]
MLAGLDVKLGHHRRLPYPDATNDPSMGLPHLFYQLHDPEDPPALIAPEPFADSTFELPPWLGGDTTPRAALSPEGQVNSA